MTDLKYEYKTVLKPRGGLTMTDEELNELGKDGYGLVYVNTPGTQWVFKKEARATRTPAKKAAAK